MVRWIVLISVVGLASFEYQKAKAMEIKVGDGDAIEITGRVWELPDEGRYGIPQMKISRWWVDVPIGTELGYGDKVAVRGKIKGKSLVADEFWVVEAGNEVWRGLGRFRQRSLEQWQRWLPDETGALVGGVIFGGSGGLLRQTKQNFSTVGMTHVLAASGYNITLVVGWVGALGVWAVGRKYLILFVLVCVLSYVFLAGMTAAVWRSAVMSAGGVIGRGLGRKSGSLWWLVITGAVMWAISPTVIEDVGFQLSFAAMAGIILWQVKHEWETTIAASLFTLPIIWRYFDQVSLVSPAANFVLLGLVPIIMEVGIVAMIIGQLGAYLVWVPARLLTLGVGFFANVPGASLSVPKISVWGVGWLFVFAGAVIWVKRNWRDIR